MQLNNRSLLISAIACAALVGSLSIGIALGRSPSLFNAQQQDSKQETRAAILDKLESTAAQQAQTQASLLDPFSVAAFGGDPFAQMQQRMDQLFGRAGSDPFLFNFGNFGLNGMGLGAGLGNAPPAQIEVEESTDEYRVVISLAEGSDVELATELDNNTLSISAQVRTEVQNSGNGRALSSTSMSHFSRAIPFNSPVDATGMQTEKSDSEVVIRIPKLS